MLFCSLIDGIKIPKEVPRSIREGPVNDVYCFDGVSAQEKDKSDMPEGLAAGPKDNEMSEVSAATEEERRGEGGAEGSYFFGVEKADWETFVGHDCEGTMGYHVRFRT